MANSSRDFYDYIYSLDAIKKNAWAAHAIASGQMNYPTLCIVWKIHVYWTIVLVLLNSSKNVRKYTEFYSINKKVGTIN